MEHGFELSADPDAHLTDVGDEVWGLILAHRTNVSQERTDYRASLATGYLLKRNAGPPTPLDTADDMDLKGLIAIGVELLWIGSSPRNQANNASSSSISNQNQQGQNAAAGQADPTPTLPTPNAAAVGSNIPKNTADSILRDYLGIYRGLGVLARARGLIGSKRGVVPWHVVVSKRGVEGLERVYGRLS